MNKHSIQTSTGTVFGINYHVAQPLDAYGIWPHMLEWVVNAFGPTARDGVWTPDQRWYCNNARFYFKHSEDLLLFVLKWS